MASRGSWLPMWNEGALPFMAGAADADPVVFAELCGWTLLAGGAA